jgi:hypothetical protein
VQGFHPGLIRHLDHHVVGRARIGIHRGELGDVALELPGEQVGLRERSAALLRQVERRSIVAMHGESVRRRAPEELRGQCRELIGD